MFSKFRWIFVFILLCLPLSVMAQDSEEKDTPHFGVRVQYDITGASTLRNLVKSGSGVTAGVVYYTPFGRLTYFQLGLLINHDTFGYRGTQENKAGAITVDGKLNTTGLKIPAYIGANFYKTKNIKLSAYSGPQLDFVFSFHGKYSRTQNGETEDVDKDFKNTGIEIGWTLGLAVDFRRHWHLHVDGCYGLTKCVMIPDLLDNEMAHIKRKELSVGIGYNF